MEEKENSRRAKNKRGKRKKIITYLSIVISTIILGIIIYGVSIYTKAEKIVDNSFEQVERPNNTSELREEDVNPIEDNVSLLIIGVDDSEKRSYEENSRSDTLILATFNKEQGDIKLVSIPRDSYVFVPEVKYFTKINHAHFFGGPKATIETVEQFMNVPIDYYVRVNFDAFIEVVDTIGGINYNVPFEMYEQDSKDRKDKIHLLPGYQSLNGEEALALARTRKYDSDIERGMRQQEIIKAVVKEASSASSLFKLDNLLEAVGNNMTTNLTFDELKSFASYGLNKNIAINSVKLEGSGGYMDDGLWYYQVDEESRKSVEDELRTHLGLPASDNLELYENSDLRGPYIEKE
ncbi:LCP family protein [Ornithinibacillus contaminans]|uniref:LCP family protein n=1 Tax=Ornithinibacillus contaminans TaxID=694055 RepID=UPI00064D8717|nr:LCP family protein [Ornithinibacillus contaminans]